MSLSRRKLFCLTCAAFCSFWLQAQPRTNAAAPAQVKSPVAIFRELLAMPPQDRHKAVAARWPDKQKAILDKLAEYEILPNGFREQRLKETELRWYLLPLMDAPRTNRAAGLAAIPDEYRSIVQERLQTWDLIPPTLKQQWKNDDMVADYFAQSQAAFDKRNDFLRNLPPKRRVYLEKELKRWQDMSDVERKNALLGFKKFFELPPAEQEETLETASDDDRRQMKQTLDSYKNLTLAQRQQCIRSFEKFTTMSVEERNQFLKNAERWNEMTPAEREKWRQLVTVAPIMPLGSPPPMLPSHSQQLVPGAVSPAMATN
jgi:hypothetical protein